MIKLKSPQEIKTMQEAGRKLRQVVAELIPQVKIGVTTDFINELAESLIKKNGGETSFGKVKNYHWSTCLPVNEQAVHTSPSQRKLEEGDVLTVDIGLYLQGFHTDFALSFVVGDKSDKETQRFLEVGKRALDKALAQVKKGGYLGAVSKAIQEEIERNGYKLLKELTGHGIGRDLHEDPFVLQYLDRPIEKTIKMQEGLVIAVEVIYSQNTEKIAYERGSDWSIVSSDGSLTACFEHTIAITPEGTVIIT